MANQQIVVTYSICSKSRLLDIYKFMHIPVVANKLKFWVAFKYSMLQLNL